MTDLPRIWLVSLGASDADPLLPQLEARGFRTEQVALDEAPARLTHYRPHAVLLQVDEGVEDEAFEAGRRLVATATEIASGVPVIVVADANQFASAADFMRLGASDFLLRPFNGEDLLRRISVLTLAGARASSAASVGAEPVAAEPAARAEDLGLLTGESKAMTRVIEQVRMVATRNTTVLITGETGTGKERVAQALHRLSQRSGREMVSVNCGGIPANLLEDEFFGHVRGAFTDAHQDRVGRFEQAASSTIFLDEIGDLPLELQPKLLRALQEREIHRIGDPETRKLDVRVVAATNVDLWRRAQEGRFREDLYYRVNVFPIHLPPLRERREDIPLFARHFLNEFCRRDALAPKQIDSAALADLVDRPWPGNIRELENAMEMAAIRCQDREMVGVADLPRYHSPFRSAGSVLTAAAGRPGSFKELVSQFEKDVIQKTLDETEGNRSRAAERLGMKRTTLVEKLKKLDADEAPALEEAPASLSD